MECESALCAAVLLFAWNFCCSFEGGGVYSGQTWHPYSWYNRWRFLEAAGACKLAMPVRVYHLISSIPARFLS